MLTDRQKDKIAERKAGLDLALQRDSDVDYSRGYFFVTLNTRGEVNVRTIGGKMHNFVL